MNIELHIERLVLEGLPISSSQGALVQAAVEAELGRLLAQPGGAFSWAVSGAVPSVPGGTLTLVPGSTPANLGRQIGQAVYASLGQGGRR